MSTAVLKNAISGETILVRKAKGRTRRGTVLDIWIDSSGNPVCLVGNEAPAWKPVCINNNIVENQSEESPRYPIGNLSR